MVVTVEPGIYVPGAAACASRISSIVTDDGCGAADAGIPRNFNSSPR